MSENDVLILRNGDRLPQLGLTMRRLHLQKCIVPEDAYHYAILRAVHCGYRHLETAQVDDNLKTIGATLKTIFEKGQNTRSDFFITSKIWNTHHSREKCLEAVDSILADLQMEYVDLMLIHNPQGFKESSDSPNSQFFPTDSNGDIEFSDIDFLETWKALEEAVALGKIRSIGVSNFSKDQIQRIWDNSKIKPSVAQFPMNPFQAQVGLREYCTEKGIAVLALFKDFNLNFFHILTENREIVDVAKQCHRLRHPVIVRWFIDSHVAVCKTTHGRKFLHANMQAADFQLAKEQIERINTIDGTYPEFIDHDWNVWKSVVFDSEEQTDREAPSISLNTDHEMPTLGIATYRDFEKLNKLGWGIENVPLSIESALENGYRHFDCGIAYLNLTHIKKAIIRLKFYTGRRAELFISAKVWNTFHSFDRCREHVESTIDALKCDYLDLMLIEYPKGFAEDHEAIIEDDRDLDYMELSELFPNDGHKYIESNIDFIETWKSLEKSVKDGLIRSIGVCNFSLEQIKTIWDSAEIKPSVLQIPVTPYSNQKEIRDYCIEKDIVLSTVVKKDEHDFLMDSIFLRISEETGKTPFQIYLRWLHEHNITVLHKAYSKPQQQSNMEIFDFSLTHDQILSIDSMEKGVEPNLENEQPDWPFLDEKVIKTRPILIPKKNGIPMIGVDLTEERTILRTQQIESIVNMGYRYVDCHFSTQDQKVVGDFLKRTKKIKRKHIALSANMNAIKDSPQRGRANIDCLLKRFNITYIDTLLLYWARQDETDRLPRTTVDYLEMWRVVSEHVKSSRIKHAGVFNFDIQQIETILESSIDVKPRFAKIEMNPYCARKAFRQYCRQKGITVIGYAPFGCDVLDDDVIREISAEIGKSPVQVVIRWFIEHEVIVMLSCKDKEELSNAIDVFNFTLTPEQISRIDELDSISDETFDRYLVKRTYSTPMEHKEFTDTVTLPTGYRIPSIGYSSPFEDEIGYKVIDLMWHGLRHVDFSLGAMDFCTLAAGFSGGIKCLYATREEMFLTGKLWNTGHSEKACRDNIERVLKFFKTTYIDLFIIEWPQGYEEGGRLETRNYSDIDYLETWRTMEQAVQDGLIRSIGLSNFNSKQIERVWNSAEIKPSVLQIEVNPYNSQKKLRDYCSQKGITVASYAPFGGSCEFGKNMELCRDSVIVEIAQRLGKTPEQVILRWSLQNDVIPLPKFYSIGEFQRSKDVSTFQLSPLEMEKIDNLNRNLRTWNAHIQDEDHQYYPFHEEF